MDISQTIIMIVSIPIAIIIFLVLIYAASRMVAYAFIRTIKEEIEKIIKQKGEKENVKN